MVTFAQAQERAEEWINGDVPAYQHREVRVREFELGFVVWAEDREDGPSGGGGAQRLVIARDSGEASLWPGLPVGEVIRRYEEEYGVPEDAAPAPEPAARIDLNQTSFLLSPPEWLQEAADKLGIPDRRGERPAPAGAADGVAADANPNPHADAADAAGAPAAPAPGPASGPAAPATPAAGSAPPAWPEPAMARQGPVSGVPAGATPWAGTDTNAGSDDGSVPLPATVFAPALSGSDEEDAPAPRALPEAKTALMAGGSQLPPTALAPALDPQGAPPRGATPPPMPPSAQPHTPAQPGPFAQPHAPAQPAPSAQPQPAAQPYPAASSGAGDIADAATSKAVGPPPGARAARGSGATTPPPPGAPGTPGARPAGPAAPPAPGATPPPGAPAGGYLPTQLVSQLGPEGPQPPAAPGPPGSPGTPPGGVHHAATMLADPSRMGPGGGSMGGPGTPLPPGPPGAPGAPQPPGPPGSPGTPPGGVHHAATMLADPSRMGPGGSMGGPGTPLPPGPPGAPGAPQPPGAPGAPLPPGPPGAPQPPAAPGVPGGGVHQAATMLAGPAQMGPGGPAAPMPPGPPGMPPGGPVPQGAPAYGYPQQPPAGLPTVGPGYQAVLRYRAPDGSEQQLIRRSAPGTAHPEWQIFHELRAMNVPAEQVLELHTELESCELPGGYCARMIREQWPQVRITHVAPYGKDHGSRRQGVQHLLTHQGELAQVADGPARPQPVRAPLPAVQPVPPVPPEGVAHELAGAFGPQGVFRFDQRAVSRQGVPEAVAVTLMWAGLPLDFGPFFWAQAVPGQPVPTLAELAQQRGVQPAADAGSYLVMGSDFGRAICVQYGTANIVAVPVEAGSPTGGPQSVPPQFVNSGLPEFVRSLALLGRMWRLRFGLNPEQAGRWTVDFQAQLAALDPAALASPESWWSVLLEQMWDGLL
ncbi:SUKH-4 family immunity protein [Streptomyces sp. NPDC048111]|uniref:SUKH-4 family immunity protein n=1 Tax=Streptomyces sp. NPDC048111 TaxID=3365500 RepID=UPI00371240F9